MPTRLQRRQSSRESAAYDLTNRIFNSVLPFFGRNARMPLVYFRSRTPGRVPMFDLEAEPAVPTAEAVPSWWPGNRTGLGQIAYPHGANQAFAPGDPRAQQFFADILLHELAHTQQRRSAFDARNEHLQVEGGADAFAAMTRDYVARKAGMGGRAAMPFRSSYGNLGMQALRRYSPSWALYHQFGRRGRYDPEMISGLPRRAGIGAGVR